MMNFQYLVLVGYITIYIFLQFLAEPIIHADDVDVDDAGNVAN